MLFAGHVQPDPIDVTVPMTSREAPAGVGTAYFVTISSTVKFRE